MTRPALDWTDGMDSTLPLFDCAPVYLPDADAVRRLAIALGDSLDRAVTDVQPLAGGQNANFKLYVDGQMQPAFHLRILSRKGYPSIPSLMRCYDLLRKAGLGDYEIVAHAAAEEAPYGYFIQKWQPGDPLDVRDDEYVTKPAWIDLFAKALIPVHQIRLPFFGYLADGPTYPTFLDYLLSMQEVIDHSFGTGLPAGWSVTLLEEAGVLPAGFLADVFARVAEQAIEVAASGCLPSHAVLLHGDMMAANVLQTPSGPCLIDWDETRAGWWPYEIARILYYEDAPVLRERFLAVYGNQSVPQPILASVIRLEHVRQTLRELCIATFSARDWSYLEERSAHCRRRIAALLT